MPLHLLLTSGGLDLYQFGARMYDPALVRFEE